MGEPDSASNDPTVVDGAGSVGCETRAIGAALSPASVAQGRYIVLEPLGTGGMGAVVRAYDPRLRREVALKRLNPGAARGPLASAIMREARAMAQINHPNVVEVYDVETVGDDVLIAMEYVPGGTLDAWLRRAPSPWPDVVSMFCRAGQGLAAAHRAGLVHGDFKPGNVLVGEDGQVSKVADFGLATLPASATEGAPAAAVDPGAVASFENVQTPAASTWSGTPRYMAPELFAGEEANPRSDQYAFCVALWSALCGSPPFAGRAGRRNGPPAWPSTTPVPSRLVNAIRRGLAPKPQDRWPLMGDLLEALALPSGSRRGKAVGAAVVGALTLGGAVLAWASSHSEQCSSAEHKIGELWNDVTRHELAEAFAAVDVGYAVDTWSRVEKNLDAFAGGWAEHHTDTCEATNVRGEQSPRVMDLRMGCLERARAGFESTLEVLAEPDPGIVHKAVTLTRRLDELEGCSDVAALEAEVPPPHAPETARVVQELRQDLRRVAAQRNAARYDQALVGLEAATAGAQNIAYPPLFEEIEYERGQIYEAKFQAAPAEQALRACLRSALARRDRQRASKCGSLLGFVVGTHGSRPPQGLLFTRSALALGAGLATTGSNSGLYLNAGTLYAQMGRYAEAETMFSRAIAIEERLARQDGGLARILSNYAQVLDAQDRFDEAAALLERARDIAIASLGPGHPIVATAIHNLGSVRRIQGQHEEAERLIRKSRDLFARSLGEDHTNTVVTAINLAATLEEMGRVEEAEALDRATLAWHIEHRGPEHFATLIVRHNLATVLVTQERFDEADLMFREVVELRAKVLGADHPEVARSLYAHSLCLRSLQRFEEAAAALQRAGEIRVASLGPGHASVAIVLHDLADVKASLGDESKALELHERALAIRDNVEVPPVSHAASAWEVARRLPATDHERAIRLAKAARERLAGVERDERVEQLRRDIDRWLRNNQRRD